MSISNLYPTIAPSLNLDFANVKALDPRISFTRTTTATYYGTGTAKAEENLLLRSQDYSATWTVTNLTPVTGKTAPDTTSTATEFTAGAANAVLTQGYTAIAGSYTFSVWLRRVTGSGDIQIAADNGTWTTKTITGTWARYDVTQTVTAGSKTSGVRVVTSGDAIEVWGAQLEQRSAVTAYTPTTTQPITNYIPQLLTAAAGVARFDHNPTTFESLGLLVEEQRTNLILQSEDFSTTWAVTRSSVTTNTVVAPNGTLTGDTLIANTDNNTHFVRQGTFTFTSGVTYTFSVFVKAAGYSFVAIRGDSTSGVLDAAVYFSLTDGSVTQSASGVTATSTDVGNGWYRLSVTATATATEASGRPTVYLTNVGTGTSFGVSFAGDDYAGVFLWGAQLEAGAFPTSYIATTAATVTRNADAASMTGTNFSSWFNNAAGSFYCEFLRSSAPIGTTFFFGVRQTSSINNRMGGIFTTTGPGTMRGFVADNNVTQADMSTTPYSTSSPNKFSMAYQTNNFGASGNGGTTVTDVSGTVPTVEELRIGQLGAADQLNGSIKKLSFYPARLTDAQLQALTS